MLYILTVNIKQTQDIYYQYQFHYIITKMETQYHFINRFLDVSEFVLTSLPEEQDQVQEQSVEKIEPEQSYEMEEVAVIDFLTPFLCTNQNNDIQGMDDFQLQHHQNLQDLNDSNQEESLYSEDQEDTINIWNNNMDLLDLIEQQYQHLHKTNILNQLQQTLQLKSNGEREVQFLKSEIESTVESFNIQQNNIKYYNFLSFKQNNIEFCNQKNSKYFNQTRIDKVERYLSKKLKRNWRKKISYHCRKQVADARLRVKGRFITRNQANKLLGMDTYNLPVQEIKNLLEIKFQKQDAETVDRIINSEKQ